MLLAYLFAAIAGGVVLGGSVVLGDHHAAGDGDTGGIDHEHGAASSVLWSVRTWTFFFAFAGVTGLLLHFLAHTGEPLTSLIAGSVGAVSGVGARVAFLRALSSGAGGTVQTSQLVGRSGQLLLPCGDGKVGQVRVTVNGSIVDLLARSDEPGLLQARQEVMVVAVKDGEAQVVRAVVPDKE